MKTADIEIGAEYGWASYKRATEQRVKVLEKGLPLRVRSGGYVYGRKTMNNGVKVEFVGTERPGRIVPARELTEPWANIAKRRNETRNQQIESRDRQIAERAARAPLAQEVVKLLDATGTTTWNESVTRIYSPSWSYVDHETIAQEAVAAGWHVIEADTVFEQTAVVTRYPGVFTYWMTGSQISLTVEQIIGLADLGHVDPDAS